MLYQITSESGYLRADLFHRETVEEAREFFGAVAESALRRQCYSILISEHTSSPLFTVDRSGFFSEFTSFGGSPEYKIALVADGEELGYSHQYLELVGQQHGINVRYFRSESAALEWLKPLSSLAAQVVYGKHPDS
jgi:hypothetical protein